MGNCSLSQLREKEVINICDGRRIGCVEDVEIDIESGRVCSLIVSSRSGIFSAGKEREVTVPWHKIQRIGTDIILVDIGQEEQCCVGEPEGPPKPPPHKKWF